MRTPALFPILAVCAACSSSPSPATAPPQFVTPVIGDTGVWIYPSRDDLEMSCARGDIIVREDLSTGKKIQITKCDSKNMYGWLDTCVPVGQYKYGPAAFPSKCKSGSIRGTSQILSVPTAIAIDCSTPAVEWPHDTIWKDAPEPTMGSNAQSGTCP